MIFGVRADGVSGVVDAPDRGGKFARHTADEKIRGLYALRREDIEYRVGVARQRSVVEGQDDLLVGERQALRILHHPDAGEFAGFKRENAARSQRVGIAGAFFRPRRRKRTRRRG